MVFFIQHYLKLLSHYSDLEILEACGKLDTNCFELKLTSQDGAIKNLRAMYRLGSIMSHNCRPNTKHTFDPDYGINMYATVPIGKIYSRVTFIFKKKASAERTIPPKFKTYGYHVDP